ncbi:ABC transporter permease [bacterium]|nr:ABC transporter permease [bacterium]
MTFLHITIKDLRIRVRDRNTLLLGLLLPVALTAVMGFAFSSDSGISEIRMSLVGPEGDDLLTNVAAGMLGQVDLFDVDVMEEPAAVEAVTNGERAAAIVIPDGLLQAALNGRRAEFIVYQDPVSTIKSGIVLSMAEQFATYANAGSALGRSIIQTLDEEFALTDSERVMLTGWLMGWMYEKWSSPPVTVSASDQETREMSPASYFAPAFAVLFLLFTLLGSARTIHEERESGTFGRLMTCPVTKSTVVSGKMLGIYVQGAIQLLILIVLAQLLFGIDWGSSPLATAAMALVTVAGASSIAIFIAAISRTGRQTDEIGTVAVLVMSIVGGSMWPIPKSFESVSRLTFNYWAQKGFTSLAVHDAGLPGIALPVVVILSISAVLSGLAMWLLRRE